MPKLPSPEEGPDALRRYFEEVAKRFPDSLKIALTNARSKFLMSGMEPSSFAERPEVDLEGESPIDTWQLKIWDGAVAWDFISKGETAEEVIRKTIDHFAWAAHMSQAEKDRLVPVYVKPMTQDYLDSFVRTWGNFILEDLREYRVSQLE